MSDFRVDTDRPSSVRTIVRRYTQPNTLSPLLDAATPAARNTVQEMDIERVQQGKDPFTNPKAARALVAGSKMAPVTEEPDQNILADAVSDISTIGKSIINLPAALVDEARQIPDVGTELNRAMQSGDNPLETIGNVARVPVIRFLPGAFVAGAFGDEGGGFQELADHPVMTALDVLPFASKAARSTATYKAAADAAETAGKRPPRPLSTVARRKLDPGTGDLVPTAYGRAMTGLGQGLGRTRIGQVAQEAFGADSRTAMREGWSALDAALRDDNTVTRAYREMGEARANLNVTPQRMGEIRTALETSDDTVLRNLAPDEKAFVDSYRRLNADLGDYLVQSGRAQYIDMPSGRELYDLPAATKINRARKQEAVTVGMAARRQRFDNLTALDGNAVRLDTVDALRSTDLTNGQKKAAAKANLEAMRAAGFDVTPFDGRLSGSVTAQTLAQLANDLDQFTPVKVNEVAGRAAADAVAATQRIRNPLVTDFRRFVNAGQWREASDVVTRHLSRSTDPRLRNVNWAAVTDDLARLRDMEKGRAAVSQWTDKRVATVQKRRELVERGNPSARFDPLIRQEARNRIEALVQQAPGLTPAQRALAAENAMLGLFDQLPDSVRFRTTRTGSQVDQIREIRADVRKSWLDLAARGLEPTFVHRVTEAGMRAMRDPSPVGVVPKVSSVMSRVFDSSDTVSDLGVAVQHQAFELIRESAQKEFLGALRTGMGKKLSDLQLQYRDAAVAEAARTGAPVTEVMRRMVGKDWAVLDEAGIVSGQRVPMPLSGADDVVMIPRAVEANLRRLTPRDPKAFAAAMDPVMNVFRTSLLALSPRWHIGNMVSGAILLAASEGPGAFLKLRQAWQMTRAGDIPEGLPPSALRKSVEWMQDGSNLPREAKIAALHQYSAGRTMRRLADQARDTRLAATGSKVVQKSYDYNALVDDMWRSAAYLYNRDKGLAKGLTPDQAAAKGVDHARRAFMEWDTLTPLERSVIRSVFPFYSWANFVIRYSTRYPADHPWRLAVASNIARNELDDLGSGMPGTLQDLFFLGEPDENGNVTGINLQVGNPFRDLGNMAALAGFLTPWDDGGSAAGITSQLNPLLGSFLRSMGVDPFNGAPELYTDLEYDPSTGQLVTKTPSWPLAFAEGILPQTRVITGLTGWNKDFKDTLQRDPSAAGRMLLGSVGVPTPVRDVNMVEQAVKAEDRLFTSQQKDQSRALATGDLGLMDRWPGLRARRDQIEALKRTGQLDQFKVPDQSVSLAEMTRSGVTGG